LTVRFFAELFAATAGDFAGAAVTADPDAGCGSVEPAARRLAGDFAGAVDTAESSEDGAVALARDGVGAITFTLFLASSSSSVFGQSPLRRRESERSARSLPSVWQVGQ
jgi:hypothetical protein